MIEVLYDKIAAVRLEVESKSAGGIIIPGSSKEKSQKAKVVAVGNGYRNENGNITPLKIKVGDVIFIPSYGAIEIKVNEENYVVMREIDVIAIER